ncbi:MAG: DNA polymerase, partial [Candidatus Thorarchaeota archaeon]
MQDRNIWVFDLETDGLLEEATTVWIGVFKNIDTGEVKVFSPDDPYYLYNMIKFMDGCHTLIGHNVLQFDFPVLEKLYEYKYPGNKIDTLVWSRLTQPKRSVPYNCPVKNRPHSIETWGYRVGRGKPAHEDWTQYSEAMRHRCTEDVEIQHLVYNELLKEMEGYEWEFASWLTTRLFEILGKQEQYGWLVDQDWMHHILRTTERWIARIDRALEDRLPMKRIIEEKRSKDGSYSYVKTPFVRSGALHANTRKWLEATGKCTKEHNIGGPYCRVDFRKVNLNSNAELKTYLLDKGWTPKEWNTNDDGEQTSPKLTKDDPFLGLEDGEGKLLAKRIQIRHRQSLVEGLFRLIRPDGRIASSVANLAETGRATHRGIVNIPNLNAFMGKMLRKIFIAAPGMELVSVDSDGCQNRMLAARVGDPSFTHTMLYGKKEDESTLHYINMRNIHAAGYPVHYNMAKNLNYAFMFGGSDNKLGKMVGGNADDGAKVRTALLSVSAGFEELDKKLREEWRSHAKSRVNKWGRRDYYDGWIRGLDGRP